MRVNPNDPASKMPIRLAIAAAVMTDNPNNSTFREDAEDAFERADALIAVYNDSQPEEAKDEG